jgi:hypothetical protein
MYIGTEKKFHRVPYRYVLELITGISKQICEYIQFLVGRQSRIQIHVICLLVSESESALNEVSGYRYG